MRDEGVTKYQCTHIRQKLRPHPLLQDLVDCRNRLFRKGLIGVYSDGIGYGNVSLRPEVKEGFYITGTQTGSLNEIGIGHLSYVRACNIEANSVICEGPVAASSESLTHAAVYGLDPGIRAVVHVHARSLWQNAMAKLPTTKGTIPYGTPEMAREMQRLYARGELAAFGVVVMAGHEDGVISFGAHLAEAEQRIYQVLIDFT